MDKGKPKEVLDAIVKELELTGICPTLGVVTRRVRPMKPSTVDSVVRSLERSGHVSISCEHGAPIRPLLTSDGLAIEIAVRVPGSADDPLALIDGEQDRAEVLESIADDIEADSVLGCAYLDTEAHILVDRGGYVYVLALAEVRRG